MVKRKKESRGDEGPESVEKKGVEVQSGTTGEVKTELKEPGLDEMKGSDVVNGVNGPTQPSASEGQSEPEQKVVRIPPLNHPFLRSSVKRPKKDPTPPPSPPKPDGTGKVEVKPDRKRCWEAWSSGETTLFFEAVNEYGKDFDAIQKYIEQRHKKLGLATHQVKNKNQVRHLYYRTCHKLFSFIDPKPDQEKTISELLVLVNFGELRKKLTLKGGITPKVGQRLNQLVTSGQTVIRVRGANRRIKTPLCKALRKLKGDENKSDPYKLPAHVLIELQPKDNKTWASVQGTAHNPRVRLMTSLKKNLGSIISYLNEKWTPHRAKLCNTLSSTDTKKSNLQLKLVLPEGVEITPHNQVTGRYMHSDSRAVFSLDNEAQVNRAVAASRAAKIRAAAVGNNPILSGRAPAGNSLDCTKDIPGLDKTTACDSTGKPRKYRPRKRVKLSNGCGNDTGDHEAQSVNGAPANIRRKSEDLEPMEFTRFESSKSPTLPGKYETEKMDIEEAIDGNMDEPTIPLDDMTWTIVPMKEMTKDQLVMGELRADNSKNLTMTDIYLMLNMPTRVKFEYELVSADGGLDERNHSSSVSSKLLQKLFTLANTEFNDFRKPKRSISVGTVTSPPRFNVPPGTNTTPPSKSSVSQISKSPGSARGGGNQRHTTSNGEMRGTTRVAAKSATTTNDKDAGVFLTPAVPSSQSQSQRLSSAESETIEAEKLFMAQIESLQKQPTFQKPNNRRGRKPLVVQRTLLPRPQSEHHGPTRHMMSMTKTGQFKPVTLGIPEGMRQKPIVRPVPIAPGPAGASRPTASRPATQPVPNPIVVSRAQGTTNPLVNFASSPIGSPGQTIVVSHINAATVVGATVSPTQSLAISTPTSELPGDIAPMNEIEAASAAAGIDTTLCLTPPDQPPTPHPPSNTPTEPTKTLMLNPSPQIIDDTMQIVSITPGASFDTPAGSADGALSLGQSFEISPSNLSSLLGISLPSSAPPTSAGGGDSDALMEISAGSESFTGFEQQLSTSTNNPNVMLPSMSPMRDSGTTTPPLQMHSPSSSPFKLGSLSLENQWLNGENADISFTSILANLESPEKKDRQSICSSSSLVVPPPVLINESSRDSTVSMDVDTHLQYMMNENSVDNVARFADLAAHITAQQEALKGMAVTN